jgi:recombination protein U
MLKERIFSNRGEDELTNFTLQNTCNRANGQFFEDLISNSLDYYYEKGYAAIEKTPEPLKPLKNLGNGTFNAVYIKKAQPDYKGVLLGGQAIIFEAKYTNSTEIKQSAVTETQCDCFERYQKMGAKCYVMVCMQGTSFYRIPWNVWQGMSKLYGHKYMDQNSLEKFKLKSKGSVVLLLEGIELLECA